MAHGSDDDEEGGGGSGKPLVDFECPTCNAHNPTGDPITDGQELLCHYCGTQFRATLTDSGKLKLREI